MFKSLFAKYITVFMLIIFVSFSILTVITTIMVDSYSTNAKSEIMSNSVESSVGYIESKMEMQNTLNFQKFINENKNEIEIMLSAIAMNADDVTVVVTDNQGTIVGSKFFHRLERKAVGVLSTGNTPANFNAHILEATVQDGGTGNAVYISVSKNQHSLSLFSGSKDSIYCIFHS